jgi:hypothetical protein
MKRLPGIDQFSGFGTRNVYQHNESGLHFLWMNHKKSDFGNTDYHQKKIKVVSNISATIFPTPAKWLCVNRP